MKPYQIAYKKFFSAFSLIEVLVFISILAIFLIAGLSVSLYSLNLLKKSEHKTLASYYGQEALEWIKKEKELNWLNFKSKISQSPITYCLNNLSWTSGNCTTFSLNNFFKREVIFINNNNNSINVNIYVYWQENNQINNINLKTILNTWE